MLKAYVVGIVSGDIIYRDVVSELGINFYFKI